MPGVAALFSFYSCEKENDYGTVIIDVKYNGKFVTDPVVYMKAGTLTRPNSPFAWDKIQYGGGDGKASFENLTPGNYYFYSVNYVNGSSLSGETSVLVVSRYRQNLYEPTINLK